MTWYQIVIESVFDLTVQDVTKEILQKLSKTISQLIIPSEEAQTLYVEGVISKETFNNVLKSGNLLAEVLYSTIAKNHNNLKVFLNLLLKFEETARFAKDTLNEYGKLFVLHEV